MNIKQVELKLQQVILALNLDLISSSIDFGHAQLETSKIYLTCNNHKTNNRIIVRGVFARSKFEGIVCPPNFGARHTITISNSKALGQIVSDIQTRFMPKYEDQLRQMNLYIKKIDTYHFAKRAILNKIGSAFNKSLEFKKHSSDLILYLDEINIKSMSDKKAFIKNLYVTADQAIAIAKIMGN